MAPQRVPPAWRRDLTSGELIAAAVVDRSGAAAGAASAAYAAAAVASARERHRVPGVWKDPVGSVRAALHREPAELENYVPLSPGASPSKAHILANYQAYVGLQEWEAIKQSVDSQAVPVKRTQLCHYLQLAPTEAMVAAGASGRGNAGEVPAPHPRPPVAPAPLPTPAALPTPLPAPAPVALPSPAESITRAAGRMCMGLSPRPPAAAAAPPRVVVLHAAAASPPRVVVEEADGAAFGGISALQLQVRTVAPNAVVVADGRTRHKGAPPRVQDRDKAIYPSAREMRPARKKNSVSKRRLNELLDLPKDKVDATELHPSKSFGVVPAQNLRVA